MSTGGLEQGAGSPCRPYLSDLDSVVFAPVDEDGGEMGRDEGVHAARGPGHISVRICEMFNRSIKFKYPGTFEEKYTKYRSARLQ